MCAKVCNVTFCLSDFELLRFKQATSNIFQAKKLIMSFKILRKEIPISFDNNRASVRIEMIAEDLRR